MIKKCKHPQKIWHIDAKQIGIKKKKWVIIRTLSCPFCNKNFKVIKKDLD